MGWWINSEEGHSLQTEGNLVWGDGPADAMGEALDQIDKEFEAAYGRKPSVAELVAGLKFSACVDHEEVQKSCIRRTYHGGTEDVTYEEFVRSAIQDDQAAIEVATSMLAGTDPYSYNADEPEFYEEFAIIDRDVLQAAVEAAQREYA